MEQYFNEALYDRNNSNQYEHDEYHYKNQFCIDSYDTILNPFYRLDINSNPMLPSQRLQNSPSSKSPSTSSLSHDQTLSSPLNQPNLGNDNCVKEIIAANLVGGGHHSSDYLTDITSSLIVTPTICLFIVINYFLIKYLVFGKLRVPEQQHQNKAIWDYFLQKIVLIFLILDAKNFQERLPWILWYFVIGTILLLSTLSKDRFEYLSASPSIKNWSLLKIDFLMGILLLFTIISTSAVLLKPSTSTHKLLLLADSTYTLSFVTSVIWRFLVLTYDMRTYSLWENRATIIYYSDLIFATILFTIDVLHNIHILLLCAFPIRFWCLRNIHKILSDIRRRYRRHRNYLSIVQLMESNFPMATNEDMDKNCDDCAICWDEMKAARKLPCGHLFHHSCLRSWLEQDTSCPTCRTCLKAHHDVLIDDIEDRSEGEDEFTETTRPHQRNHFFHFDSSRYTNNPFLSWLPTISIEGFV